MKESLLLVLFFCFLLKKGPAQDLIRDSALVVAIYKVEKNSDSTYSAEISYLIRFFNGDKRVKECQKLLLNGNKRNWSYKKWGQKLNINAWLPFVNKLPVTSYTVQNLIGEKLRGILVEYDSVNRYATGTSINLLNDMSEVSFIKSYKIYCEGVEDTITKREWQNIYYGPNNSSLIYKSTASELRKDRRNAEVTVRNRPIIFEVKVNDERCGNLPLKIFVEMSGKIIDEFRLIQLQKRN